ncbi:MAG: hypothetical protein RML56_11195 [Burkholderiales bacterium]|nr:hypothetical protein [Burkholderiales bacterium]
MARGDALDGSACTVGEEPHPQPVRRPEGDFRFKPAKARRRLPVVEEHEFAGRVGSAGVVHAIERRVEHAVAVHVLKGTKM